MPTRSRPASRRRVASENVYGSSIEDLPPSLDQQSPPPPPPPPDPPHLRKAVSSPSQRIKKALKDTNSTIKKAIVKSTKQRRFWFLIGTTLGFILPTLLFAPKLLHATGVTETDLMDDFLTASLLPFLNERAGAFTDRLNDSNAGPRPGEVLAGDGAKRKHPVFLVPGFITTGLELWEGEACAKKYFRQRLWGSTTMVQNMLTDRDCWQRHLKLDPKTGLDPEGVRLRAAQGFEAADFVIGNYWVWARLIQNLADVGYDGSNMFMFAYDWRLSPKHVEERDSYFSNLKSQIEISVKQTGEKACIVSHSMGSNHIFYFLQWVTRNSQNGDKNWVDKHIESHVNIAGPMLGTPKALTAVLSGEMRDTADIGPVEPIFEQFFGRAMRRDLFVSWSSLWTLMAKGGDGIWDGPLITFTDAWSGPSKETAADPMRETDILTDFGASVSHGTTSFLQVLSTWGLGQGPSHTERIGVSFNSDAGRGPVAPAQWHNPVAAPLPHASGMSIYCLYGTGVPTERRYFYKKNPTQEGVPYIIDTSINLPEENVRVGVKFGDGDASVPLVSLGYMCRSGWKDPHLNPGGAGTVTREYADGGKMGADLSDPFRQGPKAADHVDIMGNVDLIEDVVRIATGWGGKLEDRVASGIDEECRAIDERNGRRGGGKVEML